MDLLNFRLASLYDQCGMIVSDLVIDIEGKEYLAFSYLLDGKRCISRQSKITPKKIGQFVTCWKRNAEGITAPYDIRDNIDLYLINYSNNGYHGLFVFPRYVLLDKNIMSSNEKSGKRGFRVYAPYDHPVSKQAIKTKAWMSDYFIEFNEVLDISDFINLHK